MPNPSAMLLFVFAANALVAWSLMLMSSVLGTMSNAAGSAPSDTQAVKNGLFVPDQHKTHVSPAVLLLPKWRHGWAPRLRGRCP
jgi:hypothetical protein